MEILGTIILYLAAFLFGTLFLLFFIGCFGDDISCFFWRVTNSESFVQLVRTIYISALVALPICIILYLCAWLRLKGMF
jgi:hypothetical protein